MQVFNRPRGKWCIIVRTELLSDLEGIEVQNVGSEQHNRKSKLEIKRGMERPMDFTDATVQRFTTFQSSSVGYRYKIPTCRIRVASYT